MRRVLGLLLLAAVLVPCPALAQFDTGAVLGSVRDSTGAVLPGVTVTLLNVATGVTAAKTTDGRGAYEFFTVRAGDYKVTAELNGFGVANDQRQGRRCRPPARRRRVECCGRC